MLVLAGILIYTIIAFGSKVPKANNSSTSPTQEVTPADQPTSSSTNSTKAANAVADGATDAARSCFPGLGFSMPSSVPSSLDNWWCDMNTEYAFLGFSYEVTTCQSSSQLKKEFQDIRKTFNGRYVRIYGACDRNGFYNDLIEAAWEAGIGVYALVWFGFEGGDIWKTRRDTLFNALHSNAKAKFVVRAVQFGSEPLYDYVLTANNLASEVKTAKSKLADLGIRVTVSEMAYGYEQHDSSHLVLDAQDFVAAHMLPYFSQQASTANKAWPIVENDLNWFINNGKGKKIILSQNGWPSTSYPGVEPNSPDAVADVPNERDYAQLLDTHCSDLKKVHGGGVGWFWHLYSDSQEPGYGVYNTKGTTKFSFKPRTSC